VEEIKMEAEERKLEAEWILAQSLLGEWMPSDHSKESWDRGKAFFGDRISFETWERYYKENPKQTSLKYMEKSKEEKTKLAYLESISGKEKDWATGTEILRDYILDELNIYTTQEDKNNEMWAYREGIHVPEGRSEVKKRLRTLLGEHYSQFVFNKVIEKIEPDTFIEPKDFFNVNYVDEIPVLNGILNVNTLEMKEFDPNRIFFSKINAEYNPDAKCPMIDKFLRDVLKDESDVSVFYELAGFGLLKEYKFEKAFMMVGEGRNGKGKSIELLKRLFGISNCCSVPLSSMVADSFFISEMFGKLFNLAGDISNQDLKDTSMFKSLTGRDLINAHRKFHTDISFENYAKMVFACNELPMVYDMSRGFWDRWVLLDYPYTFVSEDEYNQTDDKSFVKIRDASIVDKITTDEEMSGLLNEALFGLNRLTLTGSFSSSRGTNEVKSTWIRKSNSFMAFCYDNVEQDCESIISKGELRMAYSNYCKKHSIASKSDFVIKRVLQDNYGVVDEKKDINGSWEHAWCGIKLKGAKK